MQKAPALERSWIERLPGWKVVPLVPDTLGRDLLAAERTLLAWFRTCLSTLALGIAVGGFLTRGNPSPSQRILAIVIGTTLVAFSMVGSLYAYLRWRTLVTEVNRGEFSTDCLGPALLVVGGVVVAIMTLILFFI
jgi:uncharacterized membrane protein YidH (DUF202 family)